MPTWDLFIARQFLGVVELVIYLDILHNTLPSNIHHYICTEKKYYTTHIPPIEMATFL